MASWGFSHALFKNESSQFLTWVNFGPNYWVELSSLVFQATRESSVLCLSCSWMGVIECDSKLRIDFFAFELNALLSQIAWLIWSANDTSVRSAWNLTQVSIQIRVLEAKEFQNYHAFRYSEFIVFLRAFNVVGSYIGTDCHNYFGEHFFVSMTSVHFAVHCAVRLISSQPVHNFRIQ